MLYGSSGSNPSAANTRAYRCEGPWGESHQRKALPRVPWDLNEVVALRVIGLYVGSCSQSILGLYKTDYRVF